jgi:hypothetical protein
VSPSGVRNSSASQLFRHCNNGGKLLFSVLGETFDPQPQDGLDTKIEVILFLCACSSVSVVQVITSLQRVVLISFSSNLSQAVMLVLPLLLNNITFVGRRVEEKKVGAFVMKRAYFMHLTFQLRK